MIKSVRSLLKSNAAFTVNGSLWIECNGERFFGPGPVDLLEHIEISGSISKAAKEMKLSYKKAWNIINRLNAAGKAPLVETSPGGKEGGGSIVSEEAKLLINEYRSMRKAFDDFLRAQSNVFNKR